MTDGKECYCLKHKPSSNKVFIYGKGIMQAFVNDALHPYDATP